MNWTRTRRLSIKNSLSWAVSYLGHLWSEKSDEYIGHLWSEKSDEYLGHLWSEESDAAAEVGEEAWECGPGVGFEYRV